MADHTVIVTRDERGLARLAEYRPLTEQAEEALPVALDLTYTVERGADTVEVAEAAEMLAHVRHYLDLVQERMLP